MNPSVEAKQVKVDVEIEAAAVALYEGNRADLRVSVSTLARKQSQVLAQRTRQSTMDGST